MSAFWAVGDRNARLSRLWREGALLQDIAASFGVSHGSVQRRVRTLGLMLRRAPMTERKSDWTAEAEAELGRLWAQDAPRLSTAEIGRQLRKTKNAVVAKAHRLGLAERDSPIVRRDEADGPANPWLAARMAAGAAPLEPFHPIARAVLAEARRLEL